MAKFLVIFNDTIDDIEINGLSIMTDKDVERFEELASSITWDFSYRVGDTKLRYSNGEDLLTRLEFKELSGDEYKAFKKIFTNDFGVFIDEDYLKSLVDDGETDTEDTDDDEFPLYGEDDEADEY